MTKISRRAVLSTTGRAAVATLALGGVSVAATDPTADAELLRLEGEVYAARERWSELSEVLNDIQKKVFAACSPTPKPDFSSIPADMRNEFSGITHGELELIKKVAPDHPFAVWERENRKAQTATFVRCHRERERIADEFAEPAADEAQSAQMDRVNELTDEILATRAASLTGMMVKLRLRGWVSEDDEVILNSIDDDLRAMAGEPLRKVTDDDEAERAVA